MTQRIGNDDEIFRGIERLTRTKQLTGERRRQHARGRAAGSMQNEYRLARGLADCGVVNPELAHHFAGVEFEVLRDKVALPGRGIVRSLRGSDGHRKQER